MGMAANPSHELVNACLKLKQRLKQSYGTHLVSNVVNLFLLSNKVAYLGATGLIRTSAGFPDQPTGVPTCSHTWPECP